MNFDSPLWCSQSSSIFYCSNAPEYFIRYWKSSYYSSCLPLNRMAIKILFFKSLEYRQVIWFNMISSDLGFSSRRSDFQCVGRCRKFPCYMMKKCNWIWDDISPESKSSGMMVWMRMMDIQGKKKGRFYICLWTEIYSSSIDYFEESDIYEKED